MTHMTHLTNRPDGHLQYLLTAYVFENLSEAGKREVEVHLAACAACRAELEELRQALNLVEGALAPPPGGESYSFEARRLERVLAVSRERRRFTWLKRKRLWMPLAAAAALVAFLGFGPTTMMAHRNRRSPASASFLATRGPQDLYEAPKPAAVDENDAAVQGWAVPAAPPAPAATPLVVADGSDSMGLLGGRAASTERKREAENEAAGRYRLRQLESADQVVEAHPLQDRDEHSYSRLSKLGREQSEGGGSLGSLLKTDQSTASTEAYDLSDLFAQVRDFPGPTLNLKTEEAKQVQGERSVDRRNGMAVGFQELLKAGLGGSAGVELRIENEKLLVQAPPEAQAKVKQFFDQLRKAPGVEVAAESRILDTQEAFLKELGADPAAAEGRLRAYYWARGHDRGLTPEQFKAHRFEIPPPAVGDEGLGEEGFRKRYGVNPFVDTARDHFSTFGMDVDTASYTLARNLIRSGKLPEPKQVRVEEFVNYFREQVPADPDRAFSLACEGGPAPFGEGLDLLKITVKARELRANEVKPAVLTFAVDASGSMNLEDRLGLVRGALKTLAASLKPDDRVGIVAYDAHAYLVLPHTQAREAQRIAGAIDSLAPGGGTNVEAGLELAYRVADEVFDPRAVNRVILASDGVANVGARGPEEILKKVQVFARRGIYLSAVGFGMGRYNDAMLETLANKGNGNYAYVDGAAAAEAIFRQNLPSTLQVLAKDAKIQVDWNPEVVSHYRLLGYENRDVADQDFRNDQVDAGEVGPGTTVTVLYEVQRRPGAAGDLGKIYLRYLDTGTGRVDEVNYPLSPGVLATSLRETGDRFRFIAAAAETAELLRASYWARNGSFAGVLKLLAGLSPEFRARPECRELVELVTRAQALAVKAFVEK